MSGDVPLPPADVAVLAASEPEAAAFMRLIDRRTTVVVGGREWAFGSLGRPSGPVQTAVICTGYGPVNAAWSLTFYLERLRGDGTSPPRLVVQAGVGGAFVESGLSIGDLALAEEEVYADVGVSGPEGWLSTDAFAEPLVRAGEREFGNRLPLNPAVTAEAHRVLVRELGLSSLASGSFLSVCEVTGRAADADELRDRWGGPLMESMEGAAAAQICLLHEVPFVEVRAVSNLVVDRDRGSWRVDEAAERAARAAAILSTHVDEIAPVASSAGSEISVAERGNRAGTAGRPRALRLAYSPCPNDTFIFHAWVSGALPGAPAVKEVLADIDELNDMALRGVPDVVKASFHAAAHLRRHYALLHSGGALGRGCGPLLVARGGAKTGSGMSLAEARVAVPGSLTTAALLLRLYAPEVKETVVMSFDRIIPALQRGEIDAGVIIHEGRFTYEGYGLECLVDLGEWWEEHTGCALPLGGILVHRRLGLEQAAAVDHAIARSLERAWRDPETSTAYVRRHAQEMDPDVCRRHIDLYVNCFSWDYGVEGEAAIRRLFYEAEELGAVPRAEGNPLFWDEVPAIKAGGTE